MSDQCDQADPGIRSAAMANALRDAPSFRVVQYPVTGDNLLDQIGGIIAILNAHDSSPNDVVDLLRYVLRRYEERKRKMDERAEEMKNLTRITGPGMGQGVGAGVAYPTVPAPPGDWTLGGAPYPSGIPPFTTAGQALANATFQPGKGPMTGKTLAEVFMEEQKRETLKKTLEDYATPPQIKR